MEADIVIEGSTATWTLPRTNGDLGGTYTGTFQFRTFLSPIHHLQSGREYRELLGSLGGQASIEEVNLAYALTQLKHRIVKAPPFWTSTAQESGIAGNVGDLNIISLVMDAAMRAENMFRESIAKEREQVLDRSISVAEALIQKNAELEE